MKNHSFDHRWVQDTIDDISNVHTSYVGRLLGECRGLRPLSNAWRRFGCIDKMGKEWGQPYFAANPEKGTQKCLNPNQKFYL